MINYLLKNYILIVGCFLFSIISNAQSTSEELNKYAKKAINSYDEIFKEDLVKGKKFILNNDADQVFTYELETGKVYDFILVSDKNVKASGIEIRDNNNRKLSFSSTIRKTENNICINSFKPNYIGSFNIVCRVVYNNLSKANAILIVMVKDQDELNSDEMKEEDY